MWPPCPAGGVDVGDDRQQEAEREEHHDVLQHVGRVGVDQRNEVEEVRPRLAVVGRVDVDRQERVRDDTGAVHAHGDAHDDPRRGDGGATMQPPQHDGEGHHPEGDDDQQCGDLVGGDGVSSVVDRARGTRLHDPRSGSRG